MKSLKLILIALMLMPVCAVAQTSSKSTKAKAEQTIDKYPQFDSKQAASLWQRWRANDIFSQNDYTNTLNLCIWALDYLNVELQSIIDNNSTSVKRRKLATDLDCGKTSEMSLFVRTFSNRMQNLAAEGKFTDDNVELILIVMDKKATYRNLNDVIFHQ